MKKFFEKYPNIFMISVFALLGCTVCYGMFAVVMPIKAEGDTVAIAGERFKTLLDIKPYRVENLREVTDAVDRNCISREAHIAAIESILAVCPSDAVWGDFKNISSPRLQTWLTYVSVKKATEDTKYLGKAFICTGNTEDILTEYKQSPHSPQEIESFKKLLNKNFPKKF